MTNAVVSIVTAPRKADGAYWCRLKIAIAGDVTVEFVSDWTSLPRSLDAWRSLLTSAGALRGWVGIVPAVMLRTSCDYTIVVNRNPEACLREERGGLRLHVSRKKFDRMIGAAIESAPVIVAERIVERPQRASKTRKNDRIQK
jgi:hypothetical protein